MANNVIQWSLYRQEIYNYVASMTIKFGPFAEMAKLRVYNTTKYDFVEDSDNPYYQNICGEYSILNTEKIYVKSVETSEQVLFKKDLWKDYPETASLYTIDSDEYKNLCLKYPNHAGLIKSIMYPVLDKDYAISAKELTILRHEPNFLRSNERESLYKAVVKFLTYMRERWFIRDYDFEDQYPIAFMSQIYSLLPLVLFTQRISNLNTDAVHYMHVWDTLNENGLGDYEDVLTEVKARWLYRNINYLKNNKGRKDTLYKLADNILKDLKVTLVGKIIYQNNADVTEDCTLIPEFLSEEIRNYNENNPVDTVSVESMDTILNRLHQEGIYPKYSYVDSIEKETRFGRTQLNEIQTQLLELKKYTINTSHLSYLIEFIYDTLLYQLSLNNLNYSVTFKDTNTALPVDLSVADAVIFIHYLVYKKYGIEPTHLPEYARVRTPYKNKRPNKSELPKTHWFNNYDYIYDGCLNTDKILSDIPWMNDKNYISATDFIKDVGNQFNILKMHTQECYDSSDALYQFMLTRYYKYLTVDKFIDFNISHCTTYNEWFGLHPDIKNLVSAYGNLPQSSLYIEEFTGTLLRKILPIEVSDTLVSFVGSIYDDTHFYEKLKSLFVYLTSHDLEYLDTERESVTYLEFGTISETTIGGSELIEKEYDFINLSILKMVVNELFTIKDSVGDVILQDALLTEESYMNESMSIQTNLNTNLPFVETMNNNFIEIPLKTDTIDIKEEGTTSLSIGSQIYSIEEE